MLIKDPYNYISLRKQNILIELIDFNQTYLRKENHHTIWAWASTIYTFADVNSFHKN